MCAKQFRKTVVHCVYSLNPVWLFTTLWTVACWVPQFMGFSRQEYCSGLLCPSPRDLPNQRSNPHLLCLLHNAWILYPPSHQGSQTLERLIELCKGNFNIHQNRRFVAKGRRWGNLSAYLRTDAFCFMEIRMKQRELESKLGENISGLMKARREFFLREMYSLYVVYIFFLFNFIYLTIIGHFLNANTAQLCWRFCFVFALDHGFKK